MDTSRSRYASLFDSKLIRLAAILLISCILTIVFTGAAIAKYCFIIHADNTQTIVYTSNSNPLEVLASEKIQLGPHDTIDFDGLIDNKGDITVNRAKKVTVSADSNMHTVYVTKSTVNDVLHSLSITVNDDDLINVSLSEPINSDMEISINRVTKQVLTEVSVIPFEVEKIPTQTLKNGRTRTLTPGKNGKLVTEIEQTLIDGKVVEEKQLSQKVQANPVSARVLVGDKNAPASYLIPSKSIPLDKNGNPISYKAKYVGKATAYSSLGKRTNLKPGNVAMNLSKFPKGTRLYIKTPDGSFIYGYSIVKDTGTAVAKNKVLVDLFFNSYAESCLFGSKTVEIYVL